MTRGKGGITNERAHMKSCALKFKNIFITERKEVQELSLWNQFIHSSNKDLLSLQGAQTVVCDNIEGWDRVGGEKEGHEGGDILYN